MEYQETHPDAETATISEIVAEDYRTAEIFKKFGLDFCCGGKKTLDEVCGEKGIDKTALVAALRNVEQARKQPSQDFNNWELDFLADYIVNTHHKYVNEALPLLDEFSVKVARVHGDSNPEVLDISSHYQAVANELRMHMHKEEAMLFPYIKQLAAAHRNGASLPPPPFGSVRNPIRMMEMEHDSAGNSVKAIQELSNNYTPPGHACNTYRVLYAKLHEFAEDLYQHIHLENNILFPKAIALEEDLSAQ